MQQPHDNAASAADTTDNAEELHRGLSNRHIQLIAIGGAIGTGLFMGSGKAISKAGPSILLVYMVIGAAIFLVLRAMGEILLSNLKYKSFSDFATDLIGRPAGFSSDGRTGYVGSHRGRRYYRNRGLYRAVVARFTESGSSTRRDYCATGAEPALGEELR